MSKPITVSLLRDLEKQVSNEEISYSRMVEILNEKAKEYAKECSQASLEKASEKAIAIYDGEFLTDVKKESITNPDNIVIL